MRIKYNFILGKVPINDEALIDDLVMILKKEVASQRNKNVDILNISSLICHKLSGKIITLIQPRTNLKPKTYHPGLRFTSCQDGLARSAMAVTLEQTRILAREYNLKEADFQNTINLLRRYLAK